MSITLRQTRALLAAFAALGGLVCFSSAQSVATAPVGAVTTSIAASSDQRFGVSLQRPALYASALQNATGKILTQTGTVPSLGSEVKYVRFTSGAAIGQWSQVTGSNSSSITIADNLQTLGAVAGDKFEVRPFWTLATLLPPGSGFPASSDPFNPKGLVLLNDPQAVGINLSASSVYFYYDGTGNIAPAGWYNNDGNFGASDNVIVSPEAPIVIRNGNAVAAKFVSIGDVPAAKVANTIVSRVAGAQDNQIYNPYPANLVLSTSQLVSSGAVRPSPDPFNPTDLLLTYSATNVGINASASAVYFYYDGTGNIAPAGWYNNDGNFGSADSVVIPAGSAFTIRKASGSTTTTEWAPTLPYTL